MNTTTNRRISLVAAGTLLTGAAAAATFGLAGIGPAGAAPAPASGHVTTLQLRSTDHHTGSPDKRSPDKAGSRDHRRDGSRDRNRDGSRDHSRDSSRDHSRDRNPADVTRN